MSPAPGAAPSLVDETDAPQVQQQPGQAGATSNGQSAPTEITTLDTPGADVPADQRTPEQIAALQQAGEQLIDEFNSGAPAGTDPLVTITNTDTGAVVNGLLVDPQDGETPVDVPVEDVVLVTTPESNVLFAAGGLTTSLGLLVDDDGNVTVIDPTPTTPTIPTPPPGQLPATGSSNDLLPLAVFIMALGTLITITTRPRSARRVG